ncbi:hypothetical protein CONCODRAFT_80766 [Conidiobolus coronatus NRRL 28638]|uniref:Sulfiredoxin n=1 Tax=Conidiobolus coronatus (strain ATCC 28846 / CBS 209.66 / NRRL 28638) TaxID=796925 RepID=A0A137NRU6_CONC2|nr:hypothetical protein CONCODRAFT_80766 [Conidiobolus coronatus NRRL 28638]|eukprot:KXN65471.1 hypothetical protein CONCODRAFT_80766 [Conidiobolus coronatus NRRL 28638]
MPDIHKTQDDKIYNIPLSAVNRPIPSVLDKSKVSQFVEDIKKDDEFPPIDVLEVNDKGQNYYFAFGGCHRWAAHKELGKETIRARIRTVDPKVLTTYLGSSNPFLKK